MSLIGEIQNDAANTSVSLVDIVLKCARLARKLHYAPLEEWASREINGYQDRSDVPSYRIVPAFVQFSGVNPPWKFTNHTPPPGFFPKDLKEYTSKQYLLEGVANLEHMSTREKVSYSLIPAAYQFLSSNTDVTLTSASLVVLSDSIRGVLSSIRHNILSFVITLEEEKIDIGMESKMTKIDESSIEKYFQINIQGNPQINIGEVVNSVQHQTPNVIPGNLDSLKGFYRQYHVDENSLSELDEIIIDASEDDIENDQSYLRKWIGRAAEKLTRGGGEAFKVLAIEVLKFGAKEYLKSHGVSFPP